MSRRLCSVAAALLLAGCAVGPDYHRPALDVPGQYRDVRRPRAVRPATPPRRRQRLVGGLFGS